MGRQHQVRGYIRCTTCHNMVSAERRGYIFSIGNGELLVIWGGGLAGGGG